MRYSKVNGLDKKVSKMVFGTATPKLFAAVAPNATKADEDAAFELLDKVFSYGINTFDCASHYGEEIMGRWMKSRGNREDCVIITKCAHPNKWRDRVTDYDILSDAHDSLAKLGTDKIDLYMLHRDSHTYPVGKIVDTLNRLHSEGKVAAFGGSNWTHQRIEEANEYAVKQGLVPFTLSSPNFGLAEQIADPWTSDAKFADGCITISGPKNESARKWYADNNIPVFAYSSLARGFFSGAFKSSEPDKAKQIMDEPGIIGYFCDSNLERLRRCEELAASKGASVPRIAMAWIYNQPLNVFAICAPVNDEQLRSNIEAMEISLTEKELAWLDLK